MTLLSKLGLSAAQFGLDNTSGSRGRPPEAEARDMLAIAGRAGLSTVDASNIFGRAEQLFGEIAPRPIPFNLVIAAARADRGPDFVEAEARATVRRLGVERVHAIVVSNVGDLFGPHGDALWRRLLEMRDAGLVAKVGVGVHATDDPIGVVRRFRPELVQAPGSLLDQRLLVDGTLARIAEMGVETHLRSVFLNGLIFLPPDRVPAQLKGAAARLSRVRRMIAEGRSDPLQASLGFALSRQEASTVLVGCASAAELSAVIAAASRPCPDLDWDDMAIDDPAALDARWAAA
jgi:aryl-alcohol dehydrogenase-like predicted oxidoreductase